MAEVRLAVRLGDRSGRMFAVKRPLLGERPSGRAAQAIGREAEVLSEVRAPELVTLQAAGEIAGLPYLATEHLPGVTLDALIAHAGALSPGAVRAVGRDLGRAIAALGAAGWVHGDISPSNVLVDDTGEVRLIDFGLAARAGEKRPEIAGKPGYIAPEAVRGVEARTAEDVYGWGVTVAECALGRRLFLEQDLVQAASRADGPEAVATLEGELPGITSALKRDPLARPAPETLVASLEAMALDRAALAQAVARAALPENRAERAGAVPERSARALTPTAPMIADKPHAARLAVAERSPPPPRSAGALGSRVIVVLAAIGLLAIGIVVGRVTSRPGPASIAIAGSLPRRTQVELNGQPLMVQEGGKMPITPGRHSLAITLPRGERREYTFTVSPGEQVVFVPAPRNTGGARDSAEDRTP